MSGEGFTVEDHAFLTMVENGIVPTDGIPEAVTAAGDTAFDIHVAEATALLEPAGEDEWVRPEREARSSARMLGLGLALLVFVGPFAIVGAWQVATWWVTR